MHFLDLDQSLVAAHGKPLFLSSKLSSGGTRKYSTCVKTIADGRTIRCGDVDVVAVFLHDVSVATVLFRVSDFDSEIAGDKKICDYACFRS